MRQLFAISVERFAVLSVMPPATPHQSQPLHINPHRCTIIGPKRTPNGAKAATLRVDMDRFES
jgi:hypothetical protein